MTDFDSPSQSDAVLATVPSKTLAGTATLSGRGLFTGAEATLTLEPAAAGDGLRIASGELDTIAVHIAALADEPAHAAFEHMPPRCTALRAGDEPVFTVEHALSALVGLGVTDAVLRVHGPEIPILDGSAQPFTDAIQAVGMVDHAPSTEAIVVTETLTLEDGRGGTVTLAPPIGNRSTYTYELDYGPAGVIPPAAVTWDGTAASYLERVAPARTYCLDAEAEQMRALGLFDGLSARDMLVLHGPQGAQPGQPIDNAFRMPDEPAWHKLLDLIGDLALAGRPLLASVRGHKSGHALHHTAARAALSRFG